MYILYARKNNRCNWESQIHGESKAWMTSLILYYQKTDFQEWQLAWRKISTEDLLGNSEIVWKSLKSNAPTNAQPGLYPEILTKIDLILGDLKFDNRQILAWYEAGDDSAVITDPVLRDALQKIGLL